MVVFGTLLLCACVTDQNWPVVLEWLIVFEQLGEFLPPTCFGTVGLGQKEVRTILI